MTNLPNQAPQILILSIQGHFDSLRVKGFNPCSSCQELNVEVSQLNQGNVQCTPSLPWMIQVLSPTSSIHTSSMESFNLQHSQLPFQLEKPVEKPNIQTLDQHFFQEENISVFSIIYLFLFYCGIVLGMKLLFCNAGMLREYRRIDFFPLGGPVTEGSLFRLHFWILSHISLNTE